MGYNEDTARALQIKCQSHTVKKIFVQSYFRSDLFCGRISGMETKINEERIKWMLTILNEPQKRWYCAKEAELLGRGGIKQLSEISGLHRNTISAGLNEIHSDGFCDTVKQVVGSSESARSEGMGRKPTIERYPEIKNAIESIVSRGDKRNLTEPLRWVSYSLRGISEELRKTGYNVSHVTVGHILEEMGYSLNRQKKTELTDDYARIMEINETCKHYMFLHQPIIAISCKKKEKAEKKNKYVWMERKPSPNDPPEKKKHGYAYVGIDNVTIDLAISSLRSWWHNTGKSQFPNTDSLYAVFDEAKDDSLYELLKTRLQSFADEIDMPIQVSHMPLGITRWNNIEHSFVDKITKNWGEEYVETYMITVSLITNEHNQTDGIVDETHKEDHQERWNYTVFP